MSTATHHMTLPLKKSGLPRCHALPWVLERVSVFVQTHASYAFDHCEMNTWRLPTRLRWPPLSALQPPWAPWSRPPSPRVAGRDRPWPRPTGARTKWSARRGRPHRPTRRSCRQLKGVPGVPQAVAHFFFRFGLLWPTRNARRLVRHLV